MSSNDAHESVLWPLSRRATMRDVAAPRLDDLSGKTIGELWDVIFRGEVIYPLVRDYFRKRFPGVKFVEYSELGSFYGAKEESDIATRLPAQLRAKGCDAVIIGIGA